MEDQQDYTWADIAFWQNRAAIYSRKGDTAIAKASLDTAIALRRRAQEQGNHQEGNAVGAEDAI